MGCRTCTYTAGHSPGVTRGSIQLWYALIRYSYTLFPNADLRGLGSDASDHCPLLLQTNAGQMSKGRFHFELFWPKFEDYDNTVRNSWQRPFGVTDPFARLDQMFRNLIRDLQHWAATRIGEVRAQMLMAREVVRRLDSTQEQRQLSDSEAHLRRRMKMQCLGLSSFERTMARQRSRIRQLNEGNANTAYFHMIARGRKTKNFIL